MSRTLIAALRVLLVLVFAGAVLAQVWFFPALAADIARQEPEVAWVRWPMLAVVVLVIAGAQVALVAIWVLLEMVQTDRVFSPRAYVWVDVIIVVAVIDTILVSCVNLFLSYWVRANPPAVFLGLIALAVCGTAFALLMAVMKGLLRKASVISAELSEVI